MFSNERPCQRTVIRLGYDAFPHPLPKLSLGGPKLLAITADYESRLLLFLLFLVFVCAHLYIPLALRLILTIRKSRDTSAPVCSFHFPNSRAKWQTHSTPRGSL